MVRIAICDDLQEQLDLIQKAVQQYFRDKKKPIEVFTSNNAMDFVDAFAVRAAHYLVKPLYAENVRPGHGPRHGKYPPAP